MVPDDKGAIDGVLYISKVVIALCLRVFATVVHEGDLYFYGF